ncbi:MAG: hypothetical protein ACE5HC_16510, partial [Candidatus Binatia bacterium]
MSPLRKQLFSISLMVGLMVGIPASTFPQREPQGEAPAPERTAEGAEVSAAEQVALGTASVLVSAAQIPLRAVTCGATIVVAGIA